MRHANGGGEVGEQAEVLSTAFIDSDSHVTDFAFVTSGRIIASTIGLHCRVTDNAQIIRSVVSCDQVAGASVIESGLFDQVRVFGDAYLFRVRATGGVRVYGDARVVGISQPVDLWGDQRIVQGTFHRSPRYLHLGFAFLTEGPPGSALVDCKLATYKRWFRVGERFAQRWYNWTPEKLDAVRRVLTEWSENEDMKGKHWGNCIPACAVNLPSIAGTTDVLLKR